MSSKFLIIRFSSFGDVIQCLGTVALIKKKHPDALIHWAIRSDFQDLIKYHPQINKVWALERKTGFLGLLQLAVSLRKEQYTHIYDAHNNLRSLFLGLFLYPPFFLRRSKNRLKRILLFWFGINKFEKKFIQQKSFLEPLTNWQIPYEIPKESQLFIPEHILNKVQRMIPFKKFIALIPSSAWDLKMWPLENWKEFLKLNPEKNFVFLGGSNDTFIQNLIPANSKNILNFAGKLSILESCATIQLAEAAIGNDTGLSHAADQIGKPLLQFIGPVLFGYPIRESSIVLEKELPCRPCTKDGRGHCKIKETKKCLSSISPNEVTENLKKILLDRPL